MRRSSSDPAPLNGWYHMLLIDQIHQLAVLTVQSIGQDADCHPRDELQQHSVGIVTPVQEIADLCELQTAEEDVLS